MRQTLKALKTGAFLFLITVVMLEIMLRVFDPLGVALWRDIAYQWTIWNAAPSGYTFPDGVYQFSRSSATIRDGARVSPDSHSGGKPVYFVGDSVTFGMSVNDDETWVNITAGELGINAINRGLPGYSIDNIERDIAQLPDDACIVWLIVGNDYQSPRNYTGVGTIPQYSYLVETLRAALIPPVKDTLPDTAFYERAERLIDDGRVIAFAFDLPYAAPFSDRVHRIPMYTTTVSYVDGHADAAGNQQIAAGVMPVLREWLGRKCGIIEK